MEPLKDRVRTFLRELQDDITLEIEGLNGTSPQVDVWTRPEGGGGESRVYSEGGKFLERGGVNFSEVFGTFTPEFAKTIPHGEGLDFYATGVSLVLHPINPFAPTVHANYRYLQRGSVGWFGGGADLTPCYIFEEDAKHFHQIHRAALDPFGAELYPKFKKQCDEYFFLPHRNETRGIGGIFFDYQLGQTEGGDPNQVDLEKTFQMVQNCARAFSDAYFPIARRRKDAAYAAHHKEFQEWRRGRYVEFNLIYDRGTLFGLKTNGRIESILMSLPAKARWWYNYQPQPGSAEAKLFDFLKPHDWLGLQAKN